jgi:hypothetical protein
LNQDRSSVVRLSVAIDVFNTRANNGSALPMS